MNHDYKALRRGQIRERIKRMSKEEKIKEFREYVRVGGPHFHLDVDRVVADQKRVGAPDSAWDVALEKIATAAGEAFGGRGPMTAHELQATFTAIAEEWGTAARARSGRVAPPPFSVRRRSGE